MDEFDEETEKMLKELEVEVPIVKVNRMEE